MQEIRIIEKQVLAERRSKLELIRFEKEQNGKTEIHEKEVFYRPAAACILLYDPDRQTVILLKQFRLPVFLMDKRPDLLFEACAGLLDEGELPEHAIIREAEEETGYRISEIEKIAEGYSSPAAFSEYVHFYIGKYSPELKVNQGGGLANEGESIEIIELSADEAKRKLLTGQIRDVKTLVLLQHALLKKLI